MLEYVELGSSPVNEECVQVSNGDYIPSMREEIRNYIKLLEYRFPNIPKSVVIMSKSFPHDFGTYYEVVARFDDEDEEASKIAYWIADNLPERWDDKEVLEYDDEESLKSQLESLLGESRLSDYVIDYVTSRYSSDEEIKSFFNDLLRHGCVSGMVGSLIYYSDTHEFYDKYYNEIEELREDYEFQIGEHLHPDGDLKNWFAWFAFEETSRDIAFKIGLCV